MNKIIIYKFCTLPREIWPGVERSSEWFDMTTRRMLAATAHHFKTIRGERRRWVCVNRWIVISTAHLLMHITFKWFTRRYGSAYVIWSNGLLLRSTPGHISPGEALQGARFVYNNNYIHGHYIINYHSSAVQECLGAERNGVQVMYQTLPPDRSRQSVKMEGGSGLATRD